MPMLTEAITDNPAAVAVLKKHGLLTADGNWRVTTVEFDNLGTGPLLDPAVVEKFATLDTGRSARVLDWMLLQAGGGQAAIEQSLVQLSNAKDQWIASRMQGHGDGDEEIAPMTQEQADAAWAALEPEMRAAVLPADQDMLEHFIDKSHVRIFGYTRHWPGLSGIYETVYKAVKTFVENKTMRHGNQTRISAVNQARQRRADAVNAILAARAAGDLTVPEPDRQTLLDKDYKPVDMELTHYATVAELEAVNGEITRFFKKPKEAKNVQFIGREAEPGGALVYKKGENVKLYDDANVTVYIPATAAAMMQVGFDNWCVANKSEFERAFHHRKPEEPHWTSYHRDMGPLAVFHVKPNIVEPKQPQGHLYYQSWKRFAVHLRRPECGIATLAEPYPGVQFFDRENRNYNPHPVDWFELMDRMATVENADPDSPPIAQSLIASIRTGMQEIVAWAKQMKKGDIKIDVHERLAAVLVYDLLNS
jgi:hypothetical protein